MSGLFAQLRDRQGFDFVLEALQGIAVFRHLTGLQLFDPDCQPVTAFFERLNRGDCRLHPVGRDAFKQCFHRVAQIAQRFEAGHSCAALECMDFTLQVLNQFLI